MAKQKKPDSYGTEPGFNTFNDTDAVEPRITDVSSITHPTDDEILTGEEVGCRRFWISSRRQSHGHNLCNSVTDQHGNAVFGERVRLESKHMCGRVEIGGALVA